MNLLTKGKQAHRLPEQAYGCQGEVWGKGQLGALGWICTHCCIKTG